MTIFWILVAGLAGLALLFVLAPLLGESPAAEQDGDGDLDEVNLKLFRQQVAELDADLAGGKLDQGQYDSARLDLEREVLNNVRDHDYPSRHRAGLPSARSTALAMLLIVPTATISLYLLLGDRAMIPRLEASATGQTAAPQGQGHTDSPDGLPPLDVLVARLEARMEQTPDDAEGWVMLGRTYFAMRDPAKAEAALAKAYALTPTDAQLLLAYAEAVAANQDNSLEGRPAELITQALELDPNDVTARWLSGMLAFQRGQFNAAAVAWKSVLAEIDPNSDDAVQLRQSIANAEQRAGVPPELRLAARTASTGTGEPRVQPVLDQHPAAADGGQSTIIDATEQAAVSSGIQVTVSLTPALLENAKPDTTVFVYAKAAAGPPMPLAVQRIQVSDLPTTLRLDDSMAMMPEMRLSSFPQVIVGARVSPSGRAMPQSGDFEGEIGPIPSDGTESAAITIDRVRP